jgi:hypothetical protein
MVDLKVTASTFGSLETAQLHWEALDVVARIATPSLLDAVLVERTIVEVSKSHRLSEVGGGGGVFASAVCGIVWPPAIVVGALAGSVGGRVMTEVRRGLSRDSITRLGTLFETESFVVICVVESCAAIEAAIGFGAIDAATVPLHSTPAELLGSLAADDAED